ncbi:hypothetical protein G6F45_014185 [Rhizopus arrhizus]|nr:hypothetical protein G6F45_014185 [Rhizopus arrhizus]
MPDSLSGTPVSSSTTLGGMPNWRATTDRTRNRAVTSRHGKVQSRPSRMARNALALAREASRSFGLRGKIDFGMEVCPRSRAGEQVPGPVFVRIFCYILAAVFPV